MSMAFDVGTMRDGTVVGGGAKGMKQHPTAAADLFGTYHTPAQGSVLAETWDYPPFSVLNAREGWWQDRKRAWLALGIESELGRGGGNQPDERDNQTAETKRRSGQLSPGRSVMPAADYSNRQRGDGRGRAI